MERRIGVVAILVYNSESTDRLNSILSEYGDIILGRMGLPLKDKGIRVISLIVEGTNEQIGAMTGKIGRLNNISVKSMLTEFREEN